jgi:hypothetical protein
MTVFAPCAASARAIASPIPEVEPVTTADLPFSMGAPVYDGLQKPSWLFGVRRLDGRHSSMKYRGISQIGVAFVAAQQHFSAPPHDCATGGFGCGRDPRL